MQTLTSAQANAFLCAMKCTRGVACDGVSLQFGGVLVSWSAADLDAVSVTNMTMDAQLATPVLFTFEAFFDAFVEG